MSQLCFCIKQSSTLATHVPDDLWDWSMHIAPNDARGKLDQVRSVIYGLHPVFPNPNRVIRTPTNGFELRMDSKTARDQTWGYFDVRVTIIFLDGKREIHVVRLNLTKGDGSPAPVLMPLPETADFAQSKVRYDFLRRKDAYGYAREVLDHAASQLSGPSAAAQRLWIAQQRALCTYKDPSLPADTRLPDALTILEEQCGLDLTTCGDPETLGLAGAIYKRLWEITRTRAHLELARAFYRRGYQAMMAAPQSVSYDAGAFTGVNVVHVCELLALEIPPQVDASLRGSLLAEADDMRQQLIKNLPALPIPADNDSYRWWISATLLEVYFALACGDPAYAATLADQAQLAAKLDPSPWEQQSSGTQLMRCASVQKLLYPQRAANIHQLLEGVVTTVFKGTVRVRDAGRPAGKVGVALSGGGFRASFFHIGVLARLAELDLLRHVEVISCVSGGSIVGAHYYLLLRKLLQERADGAIDRDHYIALVKDLSSHFLAGVQQNIRMCVAASWPANVRMIFQPSHYSRTTRLGQLYETHLYALINDGEGGSPRWLNEAFIVPKSEQGYSDAFSPKDDNWRRDAKVPMLVLNATTLNTGRNWQFTASFMGEPVSYGTSADATERLEAVYFSAAPDPWTQYRLGEAVAASSCVPALFTPVVIPELFKGRTVRLVDGGVHDNQGIRALFDHDCDNVIVSDASGQMETLLNPPHGEVPVALRTNSVLQARVRIAQNQELQARERSGQLRQCVFLHLRKNLERAVQCATSSAASPADTEPQTAAGECTEYGVERRIQLALAKLRTDLDSFTDREALTLMFSGYQMADKYIEAPADAGPRDTQWRFLEVANAAAGKDQADLTTDSLLRHLRVGSQLAFKVWYLQPVLNVVRLLLLAGLGVGVLGGLIYLAYYHVEISLDHKKINLGSLAWSALPIALAIAFPFAKAAITRVKLELNPGSVAGRIGFGLVMASVGWILCGIHLCVFDKIFLRLGRLKRAP